MGLIDILAEKGEGPARARAFIAENGKRHALLGAIGKVRRRIAPLTMEELRDITDIWVESVMNLAPINLRNGNAGPGAGSADPAGGEPASQTILSGGGKEPPSAKRAPGTCFQTPSLDVAARRVGRGRAVNRIVVFSGGRWSPDGDKHAGDEGESGADRQDFDFDRAQHDRVLQGGSDERVFLDGLDLLDRRMFLFRLIHKQH